MADIIEVTDATFDSEVLESETPVLVDFWAPWCGPCKMLMPVVQQLASENDGVKVVKINIDDSQNCATQFGVSSIPTLMVVNKGDVVDRFVGVQSKDRLQKALDEAIG